MPPPPDSFPDGWEEEWQTRFVGGSVNNTERSLTSKKKD